ncbi:unnamed protein product [Adineta steineri]|uniref:Uncharacterized protein n=1 Tax=Adineta steineri TaxID=433720 RepID=A0A814DHE4_9BILA|nr:unnamed protein product [Adineta steineri]CAF4284876.1 unnamed protein product [Adineta steineri]
MQHSCHRQPYRPSHGTHHFHGIRYPRPQLSHQHIRMHRPVSYSPSPIKQDGVLSRIRAFFHPRIGTPSRQPLNINNGAASFIPQYTGMMHGGCGGIAGGGCGFGGIGGGGCGGDNGGGGGCGGGGDSSYGGGGCGGGGDSSYGSGGNCGGGGYDGGSDSSYGGGGNCGGDDGSGGNGSGCGGGGCGA